MYKSILVPVDLSHSEKAEDMLRAAKFLGRDEAKITVIHVVDEVPAFIAAQIPTETIEDNLENARSMLAEVAKAAGVDADVEIRSGAPHHAITSLADEISADLIVVASHQPGVKDYFLGSTAAGIVRHAKCAVLVQR